jgi:phage regulator Rha-like protein
MNKNLSTPEVTSTMSSLEIAELTGKDHSDVLHDIRNMLSDLEIGEGIFRSSYKSKQNKKLVCYNLPRRECDILISGYSIKYRAIIVDRWLELEALAKNKISGFQDRVQSIRDKRDSHKPMMDGLVFRRDMLGKDTGTNHFTNENLFCNRALTGEWKPIDESELDTYDLRLLKAIRERNTLLIQHYPIQKDRKQLLNDFVIEYKTKSPRLQLV